MIQALSELPYPMDISVRLIARDSQRHYRLERKRNVLNAQRGSRNSPSPQITSQIEQIDEVLQNLAVRSEGLFDLQMTVGLRFPPELAAFQRKAMASIGRAAARMNFCEIEETTVGTFDSYLECLPNFRGRNVKRHTVLTSSATHFLPLFRPAKGDAKPVVSFQTRNSSIYGIDPMDKKLANYNWLVVGLAAREKVFSSTRCSLRELINQSLHFHCRHWWFLQQAHAVSWRQGDELEPGQGFELSPFFLSPSEDIKEERIRRHHILQIFLEIDRVDGQLPSIEIRHLLSEILEPMMDMKVPPERPVSVLLERLAGRPEPEAKKLSDFASGLEWELV